jgi:hypothetical protein
VIRVVGRASWAGTGSQRKTRVADVKLTAKVPLETPEMEGIQSTRAEVEYRRGMVILYLQLLCSGIYYYEDRRLSPTAQKQPPFHLQQFPHTRKGVNAHYLRSYGLAMLLGLQAARTTGLL